MTPTAYDELVRIFTALDPEQLQHWYGPDAEPSLVAEQLRARIILNALADTDDEEDGEGALHADLRAADVQRQNEARRQVADDESDRECPSCGAPADETGTSIPEHRPGCPYTVDYRAV